jgi:hypothetical protein
MATQQKPDSDQAGDDLSFELRRAVANAYAFVEGAKSVQTFSALTYEELLDQQIERIEGAETDLRPNELHRIDKTEQDVVAAVAKIKALPANFFADDRPKDNVNSDPKG